MSIYKQELRPSKTVKRVIDWQGITLIHNEIHNTDYDNDSELLKALHAKHKSIEAVAKQINVSPSSVYRRMIATGIHKPQPIYM